MENVGGRRSSKYFWEGTPFPQIISRKNKPAKKRINNNIG